MPPVRTGFLLLFLPSWIVFFLCLISPLFHHSNPVFWLAKFWFSFPGKLYFLQRYQELHCPKHFDPATCLTDLRVADETVHKALKDRIMKQIPKAGHSFQQKWLIQEGQPNHQAFCHGITYIAIWFLKALRFTGSLHWQDACVSCLDSFLIHLLFFTGCLAGKWPYCPFPQAGWLWIFQLPWPPRHLPFWAAELPQRPPVWRPSIPAVLLTSQTRNWKVWEETWQSFSWWTQLLGRQVTAPWAGRQGPWKHFQ